GTGFGASGGGEEKPWPRPDGESDSAVSGALRASLRRFRQVRGMSAAACVLRRAVADERKAGARQLFPDRTDGGSDDPSRDRDGSSLGLSKQGPGSLRDGGRKGGRRFLRPQVAPDCGYGRLPDPASAERPGDPESETTGAAPEHPHL